MLDQDGRNIDPRLGIVDAEASRQAFFPVQRRHPLAGDTAGSQPSYYGTPLLKQPVWIWSIPLYFHVGGVTGLSAALGAAAQLITPASMRGLIFKTRWIATTGGALSAVLLIHDLGRPERFLNMLRVFRITSPMSMGSWILTAFSGAASAATVLPSSYRPLREAAGLFAGFFGLGLAGYTGVLISQTAVPLWQQAYRTTPVLFLASGTAAAASLLEFFPLTRRETMAVEYFGLMGKIVELLAMLAFERDARRFRHVGKPLHQGFSGALWKSAKILTVAGIVLSIAPGVSRKRRILSGLLGTAASLCLRFGVFYAGKASARDPQATFAVQREELHLPRNRRT